MAEPRCSATHFKDRQVTLNGLSNWLCHLWRCEHDVGFVHVQVGFERKRCADQLLENAAGGLASVHVEQPVFVECRVYGNRARCA